MERRSLKITNILFGIIMLLIASSANADYFNKKRTDGPNANITDFHEDESYVIYDQEEDEELI